MIIEQHNGLQTCRFSNLAAFDKLSHGVTTRRGGSSARPFDSLNMGRHVGDADARVDTNRQRVFSSLKDACPVFLRQVHGNSVAVIDHATGKEADGSVGVADAAVTDLPHQLLTILVADCQPVMLYDPVQSVIANIHSGWRGSIANIIGRTVAVMGERYHSQPADIYAGIGPSLGPCCAEFVNYRREIPEHLWPYRVSEHHFDFWAISRDQLIAAGLLGGNIEIGGLCTRCRNDLFFSYRASKRTGRMAAIIGMTPTNG
jgi:YfiH family protein